MPENVSSPEELYASDAYVMDSDQTWLAAMLLDDLLRQYDVDARTHIKNIESTLEIRDYGFSDKSERRLYAAFRDNVPFGMFLAYPEHEHTIIIITDEDIFFKLIIDLHTAQVKYHGFPEEMASKCNVNDKLEWFGDYVIYNKPAAPTS